MSSPQPGEDPANRYCYTCETTTSGSALAPDAETAAAGDRTGTSGPVGQTAAEDELSLQPLPGEELRAKHRGLAPRGPGVRHLAIRRPLRPPAKPQRPKPAAAAVQEAPSPAGAPPAVPVTQASTGMPGSQPGVPPTQGPSAGLASATAAPAAAAPTVGQTFLSAPPAAEPAQPVAAPNAAPPAAAWERWRPPPKSAVSRTFDSAKALAGWAALIGILVLGGVVAYKVFWPWVADRYSEVSKPTAQRAAVDNSDRTGATESSGERAAARAQSRKARKPKQETAEPAAAPAQTADGTRQSRPQEAAPAPVQAAAKEAAPTEPAPAPAAKDAPRPAAEPAKKTESLADLLGIGKPRASAGARAEDDEAEAKAAAETAKKPAAPKGDAGSGAPPAAKEAKAEPVDALAALGLKKKDAEPAGEAGAAKEPPASPVAAAEPTLAPLNLDKINDGPEKNFTVQINGQFPGWRAKDVNAANSMVGLNHRGRDGVVALNPVNDVLTAKLIATVEIPAKFRPRLLFEVSSKDSSHEWLLCVKAFGTPLIPQVPIKMKDPVAWQEVPIDLSRWSGQRVELTLEAAIKPKTKSDKFKEQIGYFRNMHLDWPRK